MAAAIANAQVSTVKEEAVQQGEQDIDKVYKFRDAILEGATALNIETKAELVEMLQERLKPIRNQQIGRPQRSASKRTTW